MSGGPAYFALYPTDFLANIGHLGNTELGIYWRLLLVYYRDQPQPLPFETDRLRRMAMAFSPEECKALDSVVVEFFTLVAMPDGTKAWRHERADREIRRAVNAWIESVERATNAANARWRGHEKGPKKQYSNATSNAPSNAHRNAEPEPELELEPKRDKTFTLTSTPDGADPKGSKVPNCPTTQLQSLYHDLLPMLPRVKIRNDARDNALRARWQQLFAEGHVQTADEAIDFFRQYFAHVAKSRFLTGMQPASQGRTKAFRADLTWLVNATNFTKVIERGYA